MMSFVFLPEFGVDYLENDLNSHPYFANAYLFVFLLTGMRLKSDLHLNGDLRKRSMFDNETYV